MSEEHDIVQVRRDKLARWRETGRAYPNAFRRDAMAAALHERCRDLDKAALEHAGIEAAVAGRVMLRRVMGKASFITLQDDSGTIQCYLRRDDVGEAAYEEFKELWDIGDIVGVRGTLMRTNKGELSVQAQHIELLSKDLRPLPEKFHGLADQEVKYRQRYLDLIMNPDSRRVFEIRSRVVSHIRRFFIDRGFMEVETPMMQLIPGGAAARPFVTHHNALDLDLYLRVAPELYLKRLTVGGFERVFEINRNFRNEGLSTRHNPEFTMLEFYWAYADFEDLIALTEELLRGVVHDVLKADEVTYQGRSLALGKPAERLTLAQAITRYTDLDAAAVQNAETLTAKLKSLGIAVEPGWGRGRLQTEVFEALVEHQLEQPTFVTHYPAEVSPLSRRNDDDPELADRFELFVAGREIANGFSELNDPEDQAARFREQAEMKSGGDPEAMHYDADYIRALEYGLPPTAGEGIGIDRLMMLLTDSPSIRDVLLFPLMRPRDG
ncbi:MAG: lysine--tRNA ligase [Pseudomonadota bacterium]